MATLFSLLFTVALVMIIVGMTKPNAAICWGDPEKKTGKRAALVWSGVAIASLVGAGVVKGVEDARPSLPNASKGAPAVPAAVATAAAAESTARAPGETPSLAPLAKPVVLSIEVLGADTKRPTLSGTTNLPDGTKLFLTAESKGGYVASDKAQVHGGAFSGGPLGPERGLADGNYVADVTMLSLVLQSAAVKAVIGSKGENLRGKPVSRDDMGITVAAEITFFIGRDKAAAAKGDKVIGKEAASIRRALSKLLKIGHGTMASLRERSDRRALKLCGQLMREHQPVAKEIRARAEALPNRYSNIRLAAISMGLCVSCHETLGDEYCAVAAQGLKAAKKVK